jgi:hypothetical protein
MYKVVSFTAQELFDKVWNTPVLKLAQEIGVSDVGLAKACRKAGIPLPSRGYWAKQSAKRPAKPKLKLSPDLISFKVLDKTLLQPRASSTVKAQPAAANLVVPEILEDPHPLVAKWLRQVESAKAHEGHLVFAKKQVLDTHISAAQVGRSSILLDTLIKAGAALKHRWIIETDNRTTLQIDGEIMTVQLRERLTKVAIPPPVPIPRKRGTQWTPDFSSWRAPEYEWIPTGELSFHVEAATLYGTRKKWPDTKTKTLEERLGAIVDGLGIIAESVRAERIMREEQQKARQLEEELRLEHARYEESQRRLRQALVTNSEQWHRAVQLRAFINATCEASADSPPHVQEQTAFWLTWASAQADRLDPLHRDKAPVTSMTVSIEQWFTGYSGYSGARGGKDWWSE